MDFIAGKKIIATHYFGQGWAPDFWSYVNPYRIDDDMEQLREAGFNTVIIVVPWNGFQTKITPIAYDSEFIELFKLVLDKLRENSFQVMLRIGYLHDGGTELVPPEKQRNILLFSDEKLKAAWIDYLECLWSITKEYKNVLYGFLTWEDFFVMELTYYDLASRLETGRSIGYQEYLGEHYSLKEISALYGQDFASTADIPVPENSSKAIQLFSEYWDHVLINVIFPLSKKSFPPLSMEVRVDCESLEGKEFVCHEKTFDVSEDADLTITYYHPSWRGTNTGDACSSETALARMRGLFHFIKGQTSNKVFIDQFNFIDNTPGMETNTQIDPDEIPAFLDGAAKILYESSTGYSLWTFNDVRANIIRNGLFARSYPSWIMHDCISSFDDEIKENVVLIKPGGILSQNIIPFHYGYRPFNLEFKAKCNVESEGSEVVLNVRILGGDEPVYEKRITLRPGNWESIQLQNIDISLFDRLEICTEDHQVMVANFYLFQVYQENGIIDKHGEKKSFFNNIVNMNKILATGICQLGYFKRSDLGNNNFTGLYPDLWMGREISGYIRIPRKKPKYFIVKAYIPKQWVDSTNNLNLLISGTRYQAKKSLKPGRNVVRFKLGIEPSSQYVEFELIADHLYLPSQFDPGSADRRELSIQIHELGFK